MANAATKKKQVASNIRLNTGRKRVTIIDIARIANVSKSTVSLVLQGSSLVKQETARDVRVAMDQLGYVYNRSAAGLRQSKSDFVGIVIGDLTNPFFPELAAGIEDVLAGHNMMPVLANANEDPEQQATVLRSLREHGVAGVILSPARGTTAWTLAEALPKDFPVVVTMRRIDDCPFPYVGPDNVAGARSATEHLIELGHKNIAFLGGNSNFAAQRDRVEGWRRALRSAGIVPDDRLVIDAEPTRKGGGEAIALAAQMKPMPTAAICYNDVVALGAERKLVELGIDVGVGFSIVGFDDIAEAANAYPPLTTINADTRAMGRQAATMLLQLLERKPMKDLQYLGATQLVERESTGECSATVNRPDRKLRRTSK